jgi:hypothetical protein
VAPVAPHRARGQRVLGNEHSSQQPPHDLCAAQKNQQDRFPSDACTVCVGARGKKLKVVLGPRKPDSRTYTVAWHRLEASVPLCTPAHAHAMVVVRAGSRCEGWKRSSRGCHQLGMPARPSAPPSALGTRGRRCCPPVSGGSLPGAPRSPCTVGDWPRRLTAAAKLSRPAVGCAVWRSAGASGSEGRCLVGWAAGIPPRRPCSRTFLYNVGRTPRQRTRRVGQHGRPETGSRPAVPRQGGCRLGAAATDAPGYAWGRGARRGATVEAIRDATAEAPTASPTTTNKTLVTLTVKVRRRDGGGG